jgi:hypothetical protein
MRKNNHIEAMVSAKKYCHPLLVYAGIIVSALSCISPFEPDYKGAEIDLLVVDGSLIKGYETQVINISRSSAVTEPVYQPESGCKVKIIDGSGNEFPFTEMSPGKYIAQIEDALLCYNTRYKLVFSTSSGRNYESGYQKLLKTAPVDSIYGIKEYSYNPDSVNYTSGLQFYVDLNAPDDASKYYRWQIEETWEIRAWYKIFGVYDGKIIKLDTRAWPSDSLYYCWDTKMSTGIYTYSTSNLSHNILKKVPLHFKPYYSEDLTIKYCATVRQFALNEDAYYYWHQKEIELNESGQIYTTQPNQVKSNISNINNPDEKVLGFFWASSCTLKHTFEENPFVRNPIGPSSCINYRMCTDQSEEKLINLLYDLIRSIRNFPEPPVYITVSINPYNGDLCAALSKDGCIDCRVMGGTNHKPDYWGWHISDMDW